ncbi:hypothetical protein BJX68DRAFT_98380 [Aspergillus pseudodeflectus]|uniref:UDP-glucoronosyl and UDP-glucosyl transferase family protein n=1 Tax=Aspergillus pseudodeflectus TaxID=176178 RepID=A0ABR4KAJ1_9EURO
MFRRAIFIALLAAIPAYYLSPTFLTDTPKEPPIAGRANTVLYLTDSSSGLSNSHIASAFALLESHPQIQIYWASFSTPPIEPRLKRISAAARTKNPDAKPIIFHEMRTASMIENLDKVYPSLDDFIMPCGLAGYDKMLSIIETVVLPWSAEEYYAIFAETVELIESVDPSVVVVDSIQRPFVDAVRNTNRRFAILSPNALTDIIAYRQPWAEMFWKLPAMMSGTPYPIPLSSIPTNIYMQVRFIWRLITSPRLRAARRTLTTLGVHDPINMQMHFDDVPLISGDFPEAGLPLSYYPPNVTVCGPIVLDTAPAEVQDGGMVRWLEGNGESKGEGDKSKGKDKNILICLGSNVAYNERRARALGGAVLRVLEQQADVKVLWKFVKEGEYDDDDVWRGPLEAYIASGRLRIETWLDVDPVSLVNTGMIDVWVHHGGANCYYEAAMSGVRQVILPLWFDLYNFAQIAEYAGVGIWPGKETAPEWDVESLSEGFLTALQGEKADRMQEEADALREAAARYDGRGCAADVIARMAGGGRELS